MSDTVKDGAPVFPGFFSGHEGNAANTKFKPVGGLTLRDWFAGQALANSAICTGVARDYQLVAWFGDRGGIRREEVVAAQAHEFADAMIAARSTET